MASSTSSNDTTKIIKDTILLDYKHGAQIKECNNSNSEGKSHYNRNRMIDEFVTYLNVDNLPLNSCARSDFEHFVQMSLQPAFKKVPLKELVGRIVALYRNDKQVLRDYFVNFDGHVVVTADLWTSEWEERFICVTCHWIDGFWIKQNRVIGFRNISDDATCADVCGEIINVLDVFKLRNKIFGMSLGNSLDNNECVGYLTSELKPSLRELFVCDRSCVYVTNLCAQHGMEQLGLLINPIRELIRWMRRSCRDYGHVFERMCKEVGLKPRHFPLDCATSWKSTYEMLSLVYPYKEIVTKLYNDNVGELDFQWGSINSTIELFGKFNDAIHSFSSIYESSCLLVIQECIHIVHELKLFENDPLLCLVVRNMKNKWVEHMLDIPDIYYIGMILDPDVKFEGLSLLLEHYYETLGVTYCVKEKILGCRDILFRLYAHYASQMTTSKKGEEKDRSSLGSELIRQILKKESIGGHGNDTELDKYLLIEHDIPNDSDIFQWWKTKEDVFPILSKVAKDVLCTPLSIVALESACSTGEGERVLDQQWSRLQPSEIEACICKRDWDRAAIRAQRIHLQQIGEEDPWLMIGTSDSETE